MRWRTEKEVIEGKGLIFFNWNNCLSVTLFPACWILKFYFTWESCLQSIFIMLDTDNLSKIVSHNSTQKILHVFKVFCTKNHIWSISFQSLQKSMLQRDFWDIKRDYVLMSEACWNFDEKNRSLFWSLFMFQASLSVVEENVMQKKDFKVGRSQLFTYFYNYSAYLCSFIFDMLSRVYTFHHDNWGRHESKKSYQFL